MSLSGADSELGARTLEMEADLARGPMERGEKLEFHGWSDLRGAAGGSTAPPALNYDIG
jgi:hypothetical protein